ncbi:hypothetical protein [Halarchaeum sp. P4]|uniref:hypothetical protein n=1 Tax=Halarchaeum sp. P4 TaxID=3421639 RepID=UPI003EBB6857
MVLGARFGRPGRLLGGAVLGCIAALPLAVLLAGVAWTPWWLAVVALLVPGALAAAAVEAEALPVPYPVFFRWTLATGMLTTAGWRGAQLAMPPTNTGAALGYYVAGMALAVAVAYYHRIWDALTID